VDGDSNAGTLASNTGEEGGNAKDKKLDLYVDDQVGRLILEVQGLIAVLETGVEKC
jgi:hypothetical protein